MSSSRKNPQKTQRAAAHPERPGQACKALPGTFLPVVNRGRCEGKADCVEVCPYDVFEVGPIDEGEYRALPLMSRFRVLAHGKKTALTPNAAACQACGLCVVACPERAIRLVDAALRP
ncbi:MAG TPA: ferredoxin family protein [Polyangiaceae bacterium]|jgi:4Fe-4S ferredoxin|nr:ferredoxin family protein [Polyangiaceae bacterium]